MSSFPVVVADVSSESAAANWLRSKWREWVLLERDFPAMMHRAALVRASSTDPETRQAAADQIRRLEQLWDWHAAVTDRALSISGLITGGTLTGLGWLWPAAVITVALTAAWVWSRRNAEERILEMMEAGSVTVEQARQLLDEVEGGPLISAGLSLAAVGLLLLGGWVVFGGGRRALSS